MANVMVSISWQHVRDIAPFFVTHDNIDTMQEDYFNHVQYDLAIETGS